MLGAFQHWWDRRAHASRRADAITRIMEIGVPGAVLVMCHGNVNRSPYAEHRLRALLAASALPDIQVRSSGVIGPGRSASEQAQQVAAARGVDLSAHVSNTISPAVVRGIDIVLVMGPSQAEALRGRVRVRRERIFCLGDFDPEPITTREIHDPVRQDATVFGQSYDRIDRCLHTFVEALQAAS